MKRRLVEIHPDHHRQLVAIRKHCQKSGGLVPSIPYLVRSSIESGIKATVDRFMPHTK